MRIDDLLKPVSEAEPCGADLDEIGDDDYLNYMLGADNRLPQRFLDSETGAPFDRSAIDLKAEVKTIEGFLQQSRDLRLLTLEARFQALAGQLTGFSDSVQAIAALLGTWWAEVHPRGQDDDFTLRQNTVGVLEDRTTVVLPLQYAPVLRDQRAGSISLRDYQIATGVAKAREDERTIDLNQITETLRSETHRATIDGLHASISALRAALRDIGEAFGSNTGYAFSAEFELLGEVAGQLLKFIESGRSDLKAAAAAPDEAEAPAAPDDDAPVPEGGTRTVAVRIETGPVRSHAAAAAALLAAEQYFGRYEPSSPALILVHQARLLVGRPLVEALEALLPDSVEYASIGVDSAAGFALGIAKMRTLTEDYVANSQTFADEEQEIPEFNAATRVETLAILAAVSSFFRTVEPSSPVPMILGRAERFANLNFQSILSELMPRPNAQ
ncbi:MAG: type VI secretion system ImpA family N-terminal domain-containing protein [Rhizobiaceae bacterium]|nr:type VI secretion system ImpA family N-terminal domain-containing protein [Rhizobiaceae bacterium]